MKYTAQIRTEARSHNLCGQILNSLLLYVDDITYVHKADVYNHVKAGGLHDWTKKKCVMDSQLEYRYILTELETATNFELLISTPHKNEINTDCFAFICELYSVTEAVTGETVFLKVLQNSLPESFFSILLKKRLAKK